MKFREQIAQANIAVHAATHALASKIRSKTVKNKNIVIVFQQIFGDAVVFSDAIKGYLKLYPKEQGYKIYLLARPIVISFLRQVIPISMEIELRNVDFNRFVRDFSYYKLIVKEYRNFADLLIVPGTSLSSELFVSSCNASNKIALSRSIPVSRPLIMALFSRITYTHVIYPDKELMMLQRHRLLLDYLGLKDYKGKLPVLISKDKIIQEEHYCVLCPGASKMEKCWPTERFIQIINFIIETYAIKVHLCGGNDELKFEEIILSQVKRSDQVISHIGKTTFSDWSAIVQHADLVLGNDSATIHLAAASRRKAICITGAYDKYQFFPYKVDLLEEGDRLPITIMKDMPCEWCRTVGYHAGYGNAECKKRINANKCALCIDAITVEEVQEQIQKVMMEH